MNTELFERLLARSEVVGMVAVDGGGVVTDVNPAFTRRVGRPTAEVVGTGLTRLLTEPDAGQLEAWLRDDSVPTGPVRLNFLGAGEAPFTLQCFVSREGDGLRVLGEVEARSEEAASELMRLNNALATESRARARRERELERTRRELEAALEELESSYWHLKKLQEVLPVCMRCGKVKADEARWDTVIDYLKANEIFLSHGYCPECTTVVFREAGLDEEVG